MNIEELYKYVAKKYGIDDIFDIIKKEGREISYIKIIQNKDFEVESGNINEAIKAKLKEESRGIYGLYSDSESAKSKGYSGNDSFIPNYALGF